LIRKMPQHYQPLWLDVKDDIPYVWPIENIKSYLNY